MKISREVRGDVPFLLGCSKAADAALTEAAVAGQLIDTEKRGIIGYCIGGGFALEQSRAGADYQGTVVFHVTLPNPVDRNAEARFKGRVQIFHGSADPVTPRSLIDDLETELTEAGVDWQLMMYGHASHSFCDVGVFNELQRYDEKLTRPVLSHDAGVLYRSLLVGIILCWEGAASPDGPSAAHLLRTNSSAVFRIPAPKWPKNGARTVSDWGNPFAPPNIQIRNAALKRPAVHGRNAGCSAFCSFRFRASDILV